MKFLRLAATAAVAVLTLAACGEKEDAQTPGSDSENSLLSHVPHSTPYLAANLEPVPNDVIDSYLLKAEPVLQAMQNQLTKARASLQNHDDATDKGEQLILSLIEEIDGKLNRSGLESLGFDLQAEKALYGMGVFPVARIGLSDSAAMKATILRVFERAGVPAPEVDYQGISYWRIAGDDHGAKDFPAAVYIAILDDHFAFSIFPTSSEPELLPLFLGLEKPDSSDAASRISSANQKYDFAPYFTGLMDLQLFSEELLSPDSLFAKSVREAGEDSLDRVSDVCKAEYRQIIGKMPRLVMGTTEMTVNSMGFSQIVETPSSLATQLMSLVADVPVVESLSSRMLEFSFGLKFGPVKEFLRENLMAISEAPYQCKNLRKLNANAEKGLAQLNQPLPPLINNFMGVRVSLNKMAMTQSMPQEVEGLIALHVAKPEMIIGMGQMFMPGLAELQIEKGKPPVKLPDTLMPMPDTVAFAALSDNAIGISIGAGEEAGLESFIQKPATSDGTFVSLNYDTAKYLELTQKLGDQWSDSSGEHVEMAKDISEAVQKAYKAIAGRSEMYIRFNEHGLVIDSRMTFK